MVLTSACKSLDGSNVYQPIASTATPAEGPEDICMVCHSPLGLDYLGMSARTNCLSHSGKAMEQRGFPTRFTSNSKFGA